VACLALGGVVEDEVNVVDGVASAVAAHILAGRVPACRGRPGSHGGG
jgi:hypothetical protein